MNGSLFRSPSAIDQDSSSLLRFGVLILPGKSCSFGCFWVCGCSSLLVLSRIPLSLSRAVRHRHRFFPIATLWSADYARLSDCRLHLLAVFGFVLVLLRSSLLCLSCCWAILSFLCSTLDLLLTLRSLPLMAIITFLSFSLSCFRCLSALSSPLPHSFIHPFIQTLYFLLTLRSLPLWVRQASQPSSASFERAARSMRAENHLSC